MHIVTKGVRRATRLICCGEKTLQEMTTRAHRAHRRKVNQDLNVLVDKINCGSVDVEDVSYNNNPDPKHIVTTFDIS